MPDVSPLFGISMLSFDFILLSPLLFFCLVLLLFLSYLFFCLLAHSPELFFLQNSSILFVKRQAFLYGSCFAARRSKLVDGKCSMLPYGTSICYMYYRFCPFFSSFFMYFLKKSDIDKSTEWSTIAACPSRMCFFNRGNTEGTNSSKILCLMFVYFF